MNNSPLLVFPIQTGEDIYNRHGGRWILWIHSMDPPVQHQYENLTK